MATGSPKTNGQRLAAVALSVARYWSRSSSNPLIWPRALAALIPCLAATRASASKPASRSPIHKYVAVANVLGKRVDKSATCQLDHVPGAAAMVKPCRS
mgnify:CR=1 FL=1